MNRKHFERDKVGQIRGVVYRYVNQTDGEEKDWSYVGNTMNEKIRRQSWNNKSNQSYGGEKINAARQKYGVKGFSYEVLEEIFDADEGALQKKLDEKEAEYVEKYDSIEHGYNTSRGGTGNNGVNFSKTHRANIGKAGKGRKHTEETKKQISNKLKGHNVSDEAKQKISSGNKGKKRTAEQNAAQSKRMKGKIPETATKGAKEWVTKNGGGYWKNHKLSDEAKKNMKQAQQKRGTKVRVIYKDGTVKDFATMLDCANELGVGVGSIHYYLNAGLGHYHKNGFKLERI
jgi:group I intron endonuclease